MNKIVLTKNNDELRPDSSVRCSVVSVGPDRRALGHRCLLWTAIDWTICPMSNY